MTPPLVVETVEDGIVLVKLNRPDKLNALTFDMFDGLRAICDDLVADRTARAVVLTGTGRGFCSGLDLDDAGDLSGMTADEMLRRQGGWAGAIAAFRRVPVPVIAAVNGPAAGAGMGLALAADIRYAAPEARFNAAFVRIGLSGGDVGVSWLLPRIVGLGRAAEILFTGNIIDAHEAREIGLVNRVVAGDALLEQTIDLARTIAGNSPFGVRLTKGVLQSNLEISSFEAALELENRNQTLATRTADMVEALGAFREKRKPRFSRT